MPVNYPKFDKKIQDQINLTNMRQARTRPGMIANFDRSNNTATVILDEQFSESMGNILTAVPCPVFRGVQIVAPVAGARCLVGFRDSNEASPYVINYFDDTQTNKTFLSNYSVDTGIPRFMVD